MDARGYCATVFVGVCESGSSSKEKERCVMSMRGLPAIEPENYKRLLRSFLIFAGNRRLSVILNRRSIRSVARRENLYDFRP